MGKRETVKREKLPRDYYASVDPDTIKPLLPFLSRYSTYVEPCAGAGHLIDQIASSGLPIDCVGVYDIDPQRAGITQRNCLTLRTRETVLADCMITNPPFSWHLLKPILDHLPTLLPTWLLLPADVAHNKRVAPYLDFCEFIVSVGRLYWFEDRPIKGVDNFAWFLFDSTYSGYTKFYGRRL